MRKYSYKRTNHAYVYYDFRKDLEEGHNYENYIIEQFRNAGIPAHPNTATDYDTLAQFDLLVNNRPVECKFDAMAGRTNNLCIETSLLVSPSEFFIFGLPHRNGIYNHAFTRLDLWRICTPYWNSPSHKMVGDGKRTEVICAPRWETTRTYGVSLQELIRQLI